MAERTAQITEWGGPDADDSNTKLDWVAYIVKHTGKAMTNPFNLDVFRYQMVRVAALAIAAIASVDRSRGYLKGGSLSFEGPTTLPTGALTWIGKTSEDVGN